MSLSLIKPKNQLTVSIGQLCFFHTDRQSRRWNEHVNFTKTQKSVLLKKLFTRSVEYRLFQAAFVVSKVTRGTLFLITIMICYRVVIISQAAVLQVYFQSRRRRKQLGWYRHLVEMHKVLCHEYILFGWTQSEFFARNCTVLSEEHFRNYITVATSKRSAQ